MAGRGGFNAITPEQMRHLLAIRASDVDDEECDEAIMEAVSKIEAEISSKSPYFHDVDKAWDAIHRSLTGDRTPGGVLTPGTGRGPLKYCVLGEEQMIEADHHTVALVKPGTVRKVATALAKIDAAELRKRFFRLDREVITDYTIDDEGFAYTWSNFAGLPAFYSRAAADGRAVLFVADH